MKKGHDDDKQTPKEEELVEEDVDFEPEEDLGGLAAAQAKLKKLRDELKKAKAERQEYLDGWQRCKADSINARREALQDYDKAAAKAKSDIVMELIPALDSFDLAEGSEAWESVDVGWKKGMEHIREQLLEVLERNGVAKFGKVGEPFDPNRHEAVQESEDPAGKPHSIIKVLRSGYAVGDRVVRPAHVVVRK
ncbi:MAG: nucleotide exchange factor GrpE [Patescibacteria group bacterium]|nr:nucleotide exchange factor GrpE [Patescibacteria group bacterium]